MLGCFLGLTSTKQEIKCLAQGHNTVPQETLDPAFLDFKSSSLPMSSPHLQGSYGLIFHVNHLLMISVYDSHVIGPVKQKN